MKKLKILLFLFSFCFLFTGCSGVRIDSIDDLISPVSPSGDDAAILSAVNDYCKGGYSIKIPFSGKYTTSFIRYDLNGDKNDEAVAFYEPSDKLGTVQMAILNKNDDSWSVADSVFGDGTDVNSVDFCDLDNDSVDEIVVCWNMISKSSSSNLCVYKQYSDENGYKLKELKGSVKADNFICTNLDGGKGNELLAFSVSSPKAELYSYADGYADLIGETRLESSIISFINIVTGNTDQGTAVYADAVCADGATMVTELLYWSDYYDSVISPFYSYSTGKTKETYRINKISSRDIDGDGSIEIPTDKKVSGLPKGITAQSWTDYKNTVLNHKAYSYACEKDGYFLILDDSYFSEIDISYDSEKRCMTGKVGNETVFEILTVLKSGYNISEFKGYTEIYSDSGFAYLAKVSDNSRLKITVDYLRDNIKPY